MGVQPLRGYGESELRRSMQPHHKCLQRVEPHRVQFVDIEQYTGVVVSGDFSELHEEASEIGRKVAGICRPVHGVDVDAHLRPIGETDAERLEHPESAANSFADPAFGVHRQQQPPEGGCEPWRQVTVLADLDVLVEVPATIGELLKLVKQDGLTHAT